MEQTLNFMPLILNIPSLEETPTQMELDSIRKGLEDVKAGRTHAMLEGESLDNFLDRMGYVQD